MMHKSWPHQKLATPKAGHTKSWPNQKLATPKAGHTNSLKVYLATVCIKVKRSQGAKNGHRSNDDAMLSRLCKNEYP